jgi:hypothetical protein
MFRVSYDMRNVASGVRVLLRQNTYTCGVDVSGSSSGSNTGKGEKEKETLRDAIQLVLFKSRRGRVYLTKKMRVVFSAGSLEGEGIGAGSGSGSSGSGNAVVGMGTGAGGAGGFGTGRVRVGETVIVGMGVCEEGWVPVGLRGKRGRSRSRSRGRDGEEGKKDVHEEAAVCGSSGVYLKPSARSGGGGRRRSSLSIVSSFFEEGDEDDKEEENDEASDGNGNGILNGNGVDMGSRLYSSFRDGESGSGSLTMSSDVSNSCSSEVGDDMGR